MSKQSSKVKTTNKEAKVPVWFNQNIEKESITEEEAKELEDLLKDF